MTNRTSPMTTIGIDLGDKKSHYACLNQSGTLVEEGPVTMTPSAFRKAFRAFAPARVVIEAGAQSRWVAQVLKELGHEVIVSNPRQVRLISANQNKNDRNDARLLAKLGRVDPDLLSPLQHRSDQQQTVLLAIRAREQLVKSRTALLHSLRGMAKSFAIRLPASCSHQYLERCRSVLPSEMFTQLEGLLTVIEKLDCEIANYDEKVEQTAKEYKEVSRLTSVPGVGTLTALTYVVTLEAPYRFAKSRDVGCYLGLRPSQQQSGEKNPQLGITKAGDPYLRKLLVQCAHCVLRQYAPDTALKRWGLALCERGGSNAKKRAIIAVARKLAVLLHRLWVSGDRFQPFPVEAHCMTSRCEL